MFNLATKKILPDNARAELCCQDIIVKDLLDTFVVQRVTSTQVKLWEPLKKRMLITWKCAAKSVRVKIKSEIIELREDCFLFARMMII